VCGVAYRATRVPRRSVRTVDALQLTDAWPVEHVAVAVLRPHGVVASRGDTGAPFRIASVAKLLTAYATLVAVEEGTVALEDAAGPPGSTLEHLLSHASGYGFESDAAVLAPVASRRIYSNRGIEEAAALVAERAAMPFGDYLADGVLAPLAMGRTELRGSPAFGIWSTVDDLSRFVAELFAPRLLADETLAEMRQVHVPGIAGVLPGVRRYDPLDWGLGFERNFGRPGHWAGARVSRETFGHFGGAGTFLWLDPAAQLACVCLADREFAEWAMAAWPTFCDALVAEATAAG